MSDRGRMKWSNLNSVFNRMACWGIKGMADRKPWIVDQIHREPVLSSPLCKY
jgi:hypothetical protein